jgi:hypothetical protein
MKGQFLLIGTAFRVEVYVKPEDEHLGPEWACRKAFIEEASRRGGACLNDWKFEGLVLESDGPVTKE